MKTLVMALVVAGMALSFGACTEVSHTENTKKNWDGSVTRDEITVKEHPGGAVTVDKETSRTR